jgi:hypothetical protein
MYCGSGGCHSQGSSASGLYSMLSSKYNQISGTSSALSDPQSSCLTWLGGDMPRGGGPTSNAQGVTDLQAWVAAGAKNN